MKENSSFLRITSQDLEYVVRSVGVHWESLRGRRLLIAGGTGFIGKWLLASFLSANEKFQLGAHITILSRQPEKFISAFPELCLINEINWLSGDISTVKSENFGEYEFAVHGATDVTLASSDQKTLDTCFYGTQNILDIMSSKPFPTRLLLLSSGAVYGSGPSKPIGISENWSGAPDTLAQRSAYGEGKRLSEMLSAITSANNPLFEYSIARCFTFVGPYLPLQKQYAIGNFIYAAIQNQDIYLKSAGEALRTYLYTADLTKWLWIMLFTAPSGRAYNVGGSEIISIRNLAERVNKILKSSGKIQSFRPDTSPQDHKSYIPCITRIADELKLTPSFSLDDSIIRTASWLKNNQEN